MKKQIKIAYFPSNSSKENVLNSNGKSLDKYCIKCETEEELSTGNYIFDATFLIDDNLQEILEEEIILKVLLDYGYEIFRVSKVTNGTRYINVVARHITIADSLTLWIEDISPFKMKGKESVTWLLNNSKGKKEIQVFSDIDEMATAYYQRMTLYKALHDSDNSFLNRWGGEVQRRGYAVYINNRIGVDRGFTIREGKNLVGFECSSNIDKLVTRCRGQGYKGILGNYIDSPLIEAYSRIYTGIIKYDDVKIKDKNNDEGYETLKEAQDELDRRVAEEYSKNGLDKMRSSYTISFVQLEKTEEYKDYIMAESLLIGDYCRVYIPKLNVDIRVRAVTKKYDVLSQKTKEIKLNDYVENKPLSFRQIAEKVANMDSEVINNKLINKIYYFDTINDIKKFRLLNDGDYIKILGFYEIGDGGAASYIVEKKKYEWSIDIGNQLYANIHELTSVNYKQFGAYLDGENDDYNAMFLCHKYADCIKIFDSSNKTLVYNCKVENHNGIIYKKNTKTIECNSDVDLSGSTLIVDDTNATWFGIYKWGDLDSFYWDYEIQEDLKEKLLPDNYVFDLPSNDALPSNVVLKIEENPYAVRDDDGYLYSVGRSELLVHGTDGIFTSPFADDWSMSGGEEINCILTNVSTGEITSEKTFSKLKASYTYIPIKRGEFTGCEVLLKMSSNRYCSVLYAKHHNALIKDFYFKPDADKLHNKMYKNTMIYLFDSCNVTLRNIQGFNSAGKAENLEKATSGYMLRLTNCLDVTVEDSRLQGYWGATAMSSVKNINFVRCHLNRLDVHDYFYNLSATNCVFYHHGVQIGYGRGLATFENCSFYYNNVPNDSYPDAFGIAFNLTYGRSFEGTILLNNCNINVKDTPKNEYNLIMMKFRENATSITKHSKFPEIRCRNIHINSPDDIEFAYLKIGGKRYARTGVEKPTHVYGESMDNTVRWRYKNRAFDWGEDKGRPLDVVVDDFLRVSDIVVNNDGKSSFYNTRYYKCTKKGTMIWNEKPNSIDANVTIGTAQFAKVSNPIWKSRYNYNVGDLIIVAQSNFYNPYIFECIEAGISDGEFPIHTNGTILEGSNDPIHEPDLCWWTYIGEATSMFKSFTPDTTYNVGERFITDGKMFEVITKVTTTQYPPFETPWLEEFMYGGGVLKYLGSSWQPRKWYMMGSYCEANERVYKLSKHDGITTGVLPTKGNKNCVDGDLIWKYVGKVSENASNTTYEAWEPNRHFNNNKMIKVGNRVYEVQLTQTGGANITSNEVGKVYMDNTLPVKYYGEFPLAWRTAGNLYNRGDIISDSTFLVICIQGGTTNVNDNWGPLANSSGWRSDGIYVDGTCIWRKLTPTKADGFWRNSYKQYDVGKFLIVSLNTNMKIYEVIETKTGKLEPINTTMDQSFLDGTITLKYKGVENSWLANSRYNIGDIVNAGGNEYECVFDGKLVLPNKTIFENITTNLSLGYIFNFDSQVDVPTKKGSKYWTVIAKYCDGLIADVKGLPSGVNYFGGSNTINPEIIKDR